MAANPNSDSHSVFWKKNGCGGDYDSQDSAIFFPPYMKVNLAKGVRIEVVAIFSQFLPKKAKAKAINL